VGLLACSDRPSRERFPGPPGRTTDIQQNETRGAVLGGFDPLNNPISGQDDRTQRAPEKVLSGVVKVASGLKIPAQGFLFIAVRPLVGGPPLAVKRLQIPSFPFTFEMGPQDAMMAGTRLEGDVEVTVRIDQDGDPISRAGGDLFGTSKLSLPTLGVSLVIDQKVP